MASRDRDRGRKFESGAEKNRKRKLREELQRSQKGAFEKFLCTRPSHSIGASNQRSASTTEPECMEESTAEQEISTSPNNTDKTESVLQSPVTGKPPSNEALPPKDLNLADLIDPGKWPDIINASTAEILVERGPPVISSALTFPKNDDGRRFSKEFCYYKLTNGEINSRTWLIYSKFKDVAYCFCCRIFTAAKPTQETSKLSKPEGFNTWRRCSDALQKHERSGIHISSFTKWVELKERLKKKCTVQDMNEARISQEKKHWRDVLTRIIAAVQFLATTNSAFRGSSSTIYQNDNGNFLKLVEMIATFDPPMKEHLRRIRDEETHFHYLGPQIQNEVIEMLGTATKERILDDVRAAKYYSVILDCTPDISRQEQMSLILRYVKMTDNPTISEKFIQFIVVKDTTGEGLAEVLRQVLQENDLNFMDCRGQGYDNGANMKGKFKGVQARVLQINKRAMFTPCVAHSLNLVLGNMAKCSKEAMTFFGIIQRLYTLFSASTERWNILLQFCSGLTLKSHTVVRWESRIESVKPVRYQLGEICEALEKVAETTKDSSVRSEALSLVNHCLSSFDFVVALVIWYDLLHAVNEVSKTLQAEDMQLDVALQEISGLNDFLKHYRETGFTSAVATAKELASDLGWDAKYTIHRQKKRKRFFDENEEDSDVAADETQKQHEAEERFRIEYFLVVVDEALGGMSSKFEELTSYNEYFGFLFHPSKLRDKQDEEMEISCKKLASYLQDGELADVDSFGLTSEVKLMRHTMPPTVKTALDALKYLSPLKESYVNVTIAYRILLTIPVTVASGERSFSKLKLIKNYLRSTMAQDRLNGLAILSIESDEACQLKKEDMIRDFALRKARKGSFL